MSQIIGGEFSIDLRTISRKNDINIQNEGYLYSSGRAALFHILSYIKKNMKEISSLMLPDYLCPSIIEIASKFDFNLIYYPVSDTLEINETVFSSLYRRKSAVLLINYFGLVSLNKQIVFLNELDENICIIEDNVQSFYSMLDISKADFCFTSFRKTLPLPDGALVKTIHKLPIPNGENTFAQYKIAGSILKKMRNYKCIKDYVYLDLLEKGEKLINENLGKKISDFTLDLIPKIDLEQIKFLRKQNSIYLIEGLKTLGIEPLITVNENAVPLFIPIYLQNRDKIRNFLFDHQIYCPVHWKLDCNLSFLSKGVDLAEHELSLIIDQRYQIEDMDRILVTLQKALYAFSSIK